MMLRHISLAGALALALAACGGSDQPAKSPDTTSTTSANNGPGAMNGTSGTTPATSATGATGTGSSATDTTGGSGMGTNGSSATGTGTTSTGSMGTTGSSGSAGSSGSSGSSSASSTTTLSDEQIAAVTAAANKGEVDEAKLAVQKAKDPRVKKFAQMMITDHGGAITKQDAVVKKAKLTPSDNATSQQLQSDVQSTMSTLQSQTGGDFDKAYIDAQVKQHQTVLDTIDQKLLPQVKNADLKALIEGVRPKIEHHLKEAQDIQKNLK